MIIFSLQFFQKILVAVQGTGLPKNRFLQPPQPIYSIKSICKLQAICVCQNATGGKPCFLWKHVFRLFLIISGNFFQKLYLLFGLSTFCDHLISHMLQDHDNAAIKSSCLRIAADPGQKRTVHFYR